MTAKAHGWIVCLGLLAGGLLLFALLPPVDDGMPAVVHGGGAVEATPAANAAEAAEAPAAAVDLPESGDDEGRVAVDAAAARTGPVLRVFEAGSRRPLPGAEVFVADSKLTLQGTGPWLEQLVRTVAPVRTDQRGQVTLPPVTGRLLVVARSEGLFGARSLRPSQEEIALELEPDREVTARVVDAHGRPLPGVRVALCADEGKKLRHRRDVVTDGSGLARFEHTQLYRQKVDKSSNRGGGTVRRYADFLLLAAVPMFEPVMARLAADEMPARPVELRLGAAGALDVRVCGPDGSPLLTPCRVELAATVASTAPSSSPWLETVRQLSTLRSEKALGAAGTRFDLVGAGLIFDASVQFPSSRWNFAQRGVPGPGPGAVRELVLRMPSHFALVSGRLVDVEGRPMEGLKTSMQVNSSLGPAETQKSVMTTGGGRFELAVKVKQSAGSFTLDVRDAGDGHPQGCLVALPNLVQGQRHELGDVRLTPLPSLAFGTVRDDRGQPVRGASLSLQSFRPAAGRGGDWVHEATAARVNTDDAGNYQLFAGQRPLRLRLRARAKRHVTVDSHDVGLGERVDLMMPRLGRIAASGLLPSWLPRRSASYVLTREGSKVRSKSITARRGGSFKLRMDSVVSGVYDVSFTVRGLPRPIAVFTGVAVAPGEESADPRLNDIDLSRAVFRYVVRSVDASGGRGRTPRSPLLVRVMGKAGQLEYLGFPWRSRVAEFYVTEPAVEVVALSRGYRPRRARIQAGDSQLTLEKAARVELHLPGLRQLVGPEQSVRVSLVFEGDAGVPMTKLKTIDQKRGSRRRYSSSAMGSSAVADLDQRDRIRVALMHDGNYRVLANLYRPGESRPVAVSLGVVSVAVTGEQGPALTLAPPLAQVRAALSK